MQQSFFLIVPINRQEADALSICKFLLWKAKRPHLMLTNYQFPPLETPKTFTIRVQWDTFIKKVIHVVA